MFFLTRCRISMCQGLGQKTTMKFRKSSGLPVPPPSRKSPQSACSFNGDAVIKAFVFHVSYAFVTYALMCSLLVCATCCCFRPLRLGATTVLPVRNAVKRNIPPGENLTTKVFQCLQRQPTYPTYSLVYAHVRSQQL